MERKNEIRLYFETLREVWGAQHWWPADSHFEVILGAILTQNTAWTNVERALEGLRRAGALSLQGVREIPLEKLEQVIRSAGYFRQKARRLKTFVAWLDTEYGGSLRRMFARPTDLLRQELLAINGIGPETADSILLYAGQHEIFVVDAYTRRIFERHGLVKPQAKYDEIRELVERGLRREATADLRVERAEPAPVEPGPGPAEETSFPEIHPPSRMSEAPRSEKAQEYNEFHALIVQVGKHYCHSRVARCEACPLRDYLKGKTAKGKTAKLKKRRAKS